MTKSTGERRTKGSGSVNETYDGSGVWRVRVFVAVDPLTRAPRQVERTVRGGRKAAETMRRELEASVAAGAYGEKRGTSARTVADLLNKWPDQLERIGRTQTTIESYRGIIKTRLIPGLGKVELRKLGAFELDQYYAAQKAAGLAPRTIRTHHAILSGALAQAAVWGWIPTNPATSARPPDIPRTKRSIPDVDQVRKLIEACGEDTDLATAIILAAVTGARRGELCGLQWPDVDWQAGTMLIERQRVPVLGGDITVPTKTKEERTVSLGALGLAVLERYQEAMIVRAAGLGIEWSPAGWLLSPDAGLSPTNAKGLGSAITALGKRAKVPVTTHAFRRFAATQMVGDGVDVRTAAGRLGHTPEMMLRVYAGFLPSKDVDAAAGLEAKVLGPAKMVEANDRGVADMLARLLPAPPS